MGKPHICFAAPALYPLLAGRTDLGVIGGAEVQQAALVRLLVKQGYPVTVASTDYGQRDGDTVAGARLVTMFRPDAGLPGLRALHPRLTGYWSALAKADADIYYQRSASMLTGVVAAFCRAKGRRSIYAGASDPDFQPGQEKIRDPWYRAMYRYGLRRVDRIVVQQGQQAEAVAANYGRQAVWIPSVYEPPDDRLAQPGNRLVLWCGMMRKVKQPMVLVELARRMPDVQFRMVGGPVASPDGRETWAQVQQAAAGLPNLSLEGFMAFDAADALYSQARVFLNTSASEGFPNTFLQAWARGVPTASFVDVGARLDGEPVGQVCRDADEMASSLRLLLDDDPHWQKASERARRYFLQRHSAQASLQAYEALFRDLMAAPGVR